MGAYRSTLHVHRAPRWVAILTLAILSAPAGATTWIEQAQAELTCTQLAEDAERATLNAAWIPVGADGNAMSRYFRAAPANPRAARFRHLTMLAAVGWWADLINDQSLRSDVYSTIGILADQYASQGDLLFRQVARCARVHVMSAQLELDQPRAAELVAENLLRSYPATPPGPVVEDWPLVLALRELRLEARASAGVTRLATRAIQYGGTAATAKQLERSSRLLAAAGEGVLTLGDAERARQLAVQSMVVTGKPPTAAAAWRAMPTLYDASEKLNGPADAASVRQLLQPDSPPAGLRDGRAAFESLLRLSKSAETDERFDDMSRLAQAAFEKLGDQRGTERYPVPFYRHALGQLAGTRDANLDIVAKRDPAFAAQTLATYERLYGSLFSQAQTQFVADAREQMFFAHKIDNSLHAFAELYPVMPAKSQQIADTGFRLAQLRSYGRLTLATLAAELANEKIDTQSRFSVERFFSLSTQTAVWLRILFDTVRVAPGAPLPESGTIWQAFFTLDVFYNETTRALPQYIAFVRQKAPGVAALATPKPLPVAEFQRRLRPREALIATLVTPQALYVWAVTKERLLMTRRDVSERALRDLVQRLRAGLTPSAASGGVKMPLFDARAAFELHQLIFGPFTASLTGIEEITWFGHGPLGSVPPAVLVSAAPPKAQISSPAEFAATRFLVDRFAFAALADLSLFVWHRDRPLARKPGGRFLGVGAPLLSADEVVGAPRARSFELAGGLDGKALAELPKLAESVDEMKGLAAIAGDANATLWLGPEASESRFVDDALRGYRTIALATHGFLPGEVAGVPEPALMLALAPGSTDRFDGLLTSREIARLKLDADLVILSACNTASADGRPDAEAFTGLTQAFFTAGARSLMVSHWPVVSGAAAQLSVGTMQRGTVQGLPLARSLQQTMQSLRREGAASALESHPGYWGPFVIVGDGR